MCKEQIEQLEVGDKVVIDTGSQWSPYKFATVEKLTATQLTAGRERFNRRDGVKIGDGDNGYQTRLAMRYYPDYRLMTIEEAETANLEKKQDQQIKALAVKITNTHISHLKNLPLETLQQVIKLLELEETNGE
jgi:hypothetical protein